MTGACPRTRVFVGGQVRLASFQLPGAHAASPAEKRDSSAVTFLLAQAAAGLQPTLDDNIGAGVQPIVRVRVVLQVVGSVNIECVLSNSLSWLATYVALIASWFHDLDDSPRPLKAVASVIKMISRTSPRRQAEDNKEVSFGHR